MNLKGYDYYRREWLNYPGHHSVAFVLGTLSDNGCWGSLVVADCSRQTTLSLEASTIDEAENTLHKLDTLIEVAREVRRKIATQKQRLERQKRKIATQKRRLERQQERND